MLKAEQLLKQDLVVQQLTPAHHQVQGPAGVEGQHQVLPAADTTTGTSSTQGVLQA